MYLGLQPFDLESMGFESLAELNQVLQSEGASLAETGTGITAYEPDFLRADEEKWECTCSAKKDQTDDEDWDDDDDEDDWDDEDDDDWDDEEEEEKETEEEKRKRE